MDAFLAMPVLRRFSNLRNHYLSDIPDVAGKQSHHWLHLPPFAQLQQSSVLLLRFLPVIRQIEVHAYEAIEVPVLGLE